MKIFNNWDVVAKGWYIACPSRDLLRCQAKSLDICGQKIVVFRGQDGTVRALDAYCPHLGTDLGIGRVDGNLIRCFFHHWAFDGEEIVKIFLVKQPFLKKLASNLMQLRKSTI